ncbi:flavodoxin family protein [Breznakiella homolactica]|uniref:Flavodoxin family protein n=1 Tax=Breznakiella homolactica TaxID=2798577 RepID=A0A7T7XM37_9SPIR|nr:flavodoxin family protein [Breznakiella homolactica]QQO08874.1 flavodoxin family protein [Breznakiella homolactica]
MKVLLVNGSPRERGCTYTALEEVSRTIKHEGVDAEIFHIGNKPLSGCIACGKCRELRRCVFSDTVNVFLDMAGTADGFIFGTPVHYAAASGGITSFMDRAFYANGSSGRNLFFLKPAAGVVSARRAGTTAAFDQLIKYFTISQMPVVSSQYWNMVHGSTPEDVVRDLEGLQIMRTLGRNMAWLLKCRDAGIKAGVPFPEQEPPARTNFIR